MPVSRVLNHYCTSLKEICHVEGVSGARAGLEQETRAGSYYIYI